MSNLCLADNQYMGDPLNSFKHGRYADMGACVYSGQGAIEKAWVKTLFSNLHSIDGRARSNLQTYVAKTVAAIKEVCQLSSFSRVCARPSESMLVCHFLLQHVLIMR